MATSNGWDQTKRRRLADAVWKVALTTWRGRPRHPLELNTPGRSRYRAWVWGAVFVSCTMWLAGVAAALVWYALQPFGREILGTATFLLVNLAILILMVAVLVGILGAVFGLWDNPCASANHPRRPGRE